MGVSEAVCGRGGMTGEGADEAERISVKGAVPRGMSRGSAEETTTSFDLYTVGLARRLRADGWDLIARELPALGDVIRS